MSEKPETVDIFDIAPGTRTLVVTHPSTKQPIGLEIDFQSFDSEECRALERQIRNEAIHSGRNSLSDKNRTRNEYRMFRAAMVAWRWKGITLGGKANPELTVDNVALLFEKLPWVKRKLDAEFTDEASFFETPESTSVAP